MAKSVPQGWAERIARKIVAVAFRDCPPATPSWAPILGMTPDELHALIVKVLQAEEPRESTPAVRDARPWLTEIAVARLIIRHVTIGRLTIEERMDEALDAARAICALFPDPHLAPQEEPCKHDRRAEDNECLDCGRRGIRVNWPQEERRGPRRVRGGC